MWRIIASSFTLTDAQMNAYLAARNPKDGFVTIVAEYSHYPKVKRIATGVKVNEKYWDKATRLVKANGTANVTKTNDQLKAVLKNLEDAVTELYKANSNVLPTVPQLNEYLAQQAAPATVETEAAPTPLTTALAAYIKAATGRKGKWQPLTVKTFQTLLPLIESYELATKTTWLMETLTNAQVSGWQEWLMAERNYRNSTLGKQVKKLKQFLHDAPIGTLNPLFNVSKVKAQHEMKVKPTIITLTAKEIMKLDSLVIENEKLSRAKELFLLECFTGLRFSDVIRIEKADIHNGFIHFQTKKTVDALIIPLFSQTKAILEKYDYDLKPLSITNQKLNDNLKELFALPQILEAIPTLKNTIKLNEERGTVRSSEIVARNTVITTHVGRKSFVTMGLALGQSAQTVKLWSGHKSDASFSRYVDAASGQVEAANALQQAINAL